MDVHPSWGPATVTKVKQARYLCSQRAFFFCTSSAVCWYDLYRFALMLQRLFAILIVLWVLRWKKSGERLISRFSFLFLWLTGLILLIGVLGLPIFSFKVDMEITCLCLPADKEAEFCCCLCCLETASPVRNTSVMITRQWIYNRIANGICIGWFNVVKTVQPLTELPHKQFPFELLKETLKWVYFIDRCKFCGVSCVCPFPQ